jgi:hypothetical protein
MTFFVRCPVNDCLWFAVNPELADRVERIPGFIKQMAKAFADQKRHFNEANMMRRFADYYTPNSKNYLDWMLGSGFGDDPSCERYLLKVYVLCFPDRLNVVADCSCATRSEKKQLDLWRKKAAETVRRSCSLTTLLFASTFSRSSVICYIVAHLLTCQRPGRPDGRGL